MKIVSELVQSLERWVAEMGELMTELHKDLRGRGPEACSESGCQHEATSLGRCPSHYGKYRRQRCKEMGVSRLRDIPKNVEPDPAQTLLFSESSPCLARMMGEYNWLSCCRQQGHEGDHNYVVEKLVNETKETHGQEKAQVG